MTWFDFMPVSKLKITYVILSFLLLINCSESNSGNISTKQQEPGKLLFASSDSDLVKGFMWAKDQALNYVNDGDPVGNWYEAALPQREAFCMRDVSHQSVGAHALGLQSYTKNMLRKFAENISYEKDWCTYWEINRHNLPAPVDYKNDKEFWYNLTANFDVLDACYRMFTWSHDPDYIHNSDFNKFYQKSLRDYEDRWDLGMDKILKRSRFMNRDSFDRENYYQYCRGIPSYHEGDPGKTRLGVDLLAFQAAAYRSYIEILKLRGETGKIDEFDGKLQAVRNLIVDKFWNESKNRFYDLLLTDGKYVSGGSMVTYLLYNDVVESNEKNIKTATWLLENSDINIEMRSYLPEIFYRYGLFEAAYNEIQQLCSPETKRREYPEVSFAVVGAYVTGLMGMEPSVEQGKVSTLSRLTSKTEWAEIEYLPCHNNIINIKHEGMNKSILTNRSGEKMKWIAGFYGDSEYLVVDGKQEKTRSKIDKTGKKVVWVEVNVNSSKTVSVNKED